MPSATQSPDHLLNRRPQRADAALSRPKYWHPRLSPGPRCTVPTSQISIAPADRGARSPAGFLHWRLSNAGPATLLCVDSSVMGPASETRHTERRPGHLVVCGQLSDGAGIRNPSQKRKFPKLREEPMTRPPLQPFTAETA